VTTKQAAKRKRRPGADKRSPNRIGIAQYADTLRAMRLAGTTLQNIADWLLATHKLKVTRERVRQVLARVLTKQDKLKLAELLAPVTTCKLCGKKGPTSLGYCRLHYARFKAGWPADKMALPVDKTRHKSGVCKLCGKPTQPGKRTRGMHAPTCYTRWRYDNVPGEKQRVRENNERWLAKALKDKGYAKKWKQEQREYQRRYQALARKRAKAAKAAEVAKAAKLGKVGKAKAVNRALPKTAGRALP